VGQLAKVSILQGDVILGYPKHNFASILEHEIIWKWPKP
jgi:hypothetical protein